MLEQSQKHVACLYAALQDFTLAHFHVWLPLAQSDDQASHFKWKHSARDEQDARYRSQGWRGSFEKGIDPWVITG